jgi:hypothetical protein
MPGPTINSPKLIPEEMELKLINDDTQLLATSQKHEENFMITGGGSGCAGQDGMVSHLFFQLWHTLVHRHFSHKKILPALSYCQRG